MFPVFDFPAEHRASPDGGGAGRDEGQGGSVGGESCDGTTQESPGRARVRAVVEGEDVAVHCTRCHYDGSAHVDSGCRSVAAIYAGIRGPFKEGPGPEGAWSFLCPALGRRQTGVCWTLSWA